MRFLNVPHATRSSCGPSPMYSICPTPHRSSSLTRCQGDVAAVTESGGSSGNRLHRRQVLQTGAAALLMHTTATAFACAANAATSSGSTQQFSSQYDSYAAQYDQLDSGAAAELFGIPRLRQDLVGAAHGQVLEVAIGTGINLPLYNRQRVQSLTGLDLSQGMLQQAQSKLQAEGQGLQVTLQQGDVEALPFDANTFDCVVDTFSLCVFPEPAKALREMSRVLNPGGRLLLLEHSRSRQPVLGWYQDITTPAVAALGKGCKWNQDVMGMLTQAELRPIRVRTSLAGVITLVEAEKL